MSILKEFPKGAEASREAAVEVRDISVSGQQSISEAATTKLLSRDRSWILITFGFRGWPTPSDSESGVFLRHTTVVPNPEWDVEMPASFTKLIFIDRLYQVLRGCRSRWVRRIAIENVRLG